MARRFDVRHLEQVPDNTLPAPHSPPSACLRSREASQHMQTYVSIRQHISVARGFHPRLPGSQHLQPAQVCARVNVSINEK